MVFPRWKTGGEACGWGDETETKKWNMRNKFPLKMCVRYWLTQLGGCRNDSKCRWVIGNKSVLGFPSLVGSEKPPQKLPLKILKASCPCLPPLLGGIQKHSLKVLETSRGEKIENIFRSHSMTGASARKDSQVDLGMKNASAGKGFLLLLLISIFLQLLLRSLLLVRLMERHHKDDNRGMLKKSLQIFLGFEEKESKRKRDFRATSGFLFRSNEMEQSGVDFGGEGEYQYNGIHEGWWVGFGRRVA